MELAAKATFSSVFVLLLNFFCGDMKLINYILASIVQIHLKLVSPTKGNLTKKTYKTEPETHYSWGNINRGEIKMVVERLGIKWELEGDESSGYGEREFLRMFDEEKETCLEEVKEAFDVFDENRDGFIDVRELQRVLCILGLQNGTEEDEYCREMIAKFDENGDGLIDFSEFVRLMDNCFS